MSLEQSLLELFNVPGGVKQFMTLHKLSPTHCQSPTKMFVIVHHFNFKVVKMYINATIQRLN